MSDPLPGAQAHIEAALKLAATIDDLAPDTPLLPIAKVGVIGGGRGKLPAHPRQRLARYA